MRKHILAIAALAGVTLSGAAYAHATLKAENPAPNAVVSNSLKEVRLTFSEAVTPAFSGIKLTDLTGKAIATGAPHLDAKNQKALVVPLKSTLAAGKYQLAWYAVSDDAHRVTGKYSFSVKR
ncbi:MAG TPA: copper homeostasis periplasmic binding protein CopC [Micropepsaceae bacterium]|nr:copper homeostasis periplasmic binding protein CopC [Micropepsaceae bacterium]